MIRKLRNAALALAATVGLFGGVALGATSAAATAPAHVVIHTASPNDWWT